MRMSKIVFALLGAVALLVACSDDEPPPATPTPKLTREQLMDGRVCATCHPDHFREWSGSMHAYAAQDPVFLALNKRMQRETNGKNGNFCVNCHAPVAVRLGLTTDGTNLASLDPKVLGVTCFFCHTGILKAGALNNNPLQLSTDNVMHGGFPDPVPNEGHFAAYDAFTDYKNDASALLCGVCHDIVNPKGTPIERTFREWRGSEIALEQRKNCGACHMPERIGLAAQAPGVLVRKVHDHSLPGVDVALTPFPEMAAQREAVQKILDASLSASLCVRSDGGNVTIDVTLRTETVGHHFPSGAAQDRRGWVEIEARRGGSVAFTSGRVADRVAASGTDPQLFLLHDTHFDETGKETHLFWNTTKVEPHTVPVRRTRNEPDSARELAHRYVFAGTMPDEVTMHLRLRPVDFDLVEDLVGSGDLDPGVAAAIPTFTLRSGELTWRAGAECVSTAP
jgi:hypothetical protein